MVCHQLVCHWRRPTTSLLTTLALMSACYGIIAIMSEVSTTFSKKLSHFNTRNKMLLASCGELHVILKGSKKYEVQVIY